MDHICKAPCHTSLTNLIRQLHQKTMLVCHFVDEHYSILVLQLDQRQTSFNQHKPACWSFQRGRFLSGYCQQQSYLAD